MSLWGHLDICPLLNQFHLVSISLSELSLLTTLRARGDTKKFHSDLTYLLVSTDEEEASDKSIWPCPSVGKPVSGQDFHCGGSGLATDCLDLWWS